MNSYVFECWFIFQMIFIRCDFIFEAKTFGTLNCNFIAGENASASYPEKHVNDPLSPSDALRVLNLIRSHFTMSSLPASATCSLTPLKQRFLKIDENLVYAPCTLSLLQVWKKITAMRSSSNDCSPLELRLWCHTEQSPDYTIEKSQPHKPLDHYVPRDLWWLWSRHGWQWRVLWRARVLIRRACEPNFAHFMWIPPCDYRSKLRNNFLQVHFPLMNPLSPIYEDSVSLSVTGFGADHRNDWCGGRRLMFRRHVSLPVCRCRRISCFFCFCRSLFVLLLPPFAACFPSSFISD